MTETTDKRLAGIRTPYADMPAAVRSWVDEQLGGHVETVIPRTGGMSPAVASTVITKAGERAFVKAVSVDINPDTPTHFRHEINVLTTIGPAPYRADLRAAYDDDHWVAILLEDVDGDHPDWDDPRQVDAVFEAVTAQARELTPAPPSLDIDSVNTILAKHWDTMLADPPAELFALLPDWAQSMYPELMTLVRADGRPIEERTLCHWDIRHDNLLVRRSDGQVLTLDWGMARRGPWWGDVFVMAIEWAELDLFDVLLDRTGLNDRDEQDATRLLISLGCFLVESSGLPAPPGLPHLPRFRRALGERCLTGVRRRLGSAGF
jgi:hypothetical protein